MARMLKTYLTPVSISKINLKRTKHLKLEISGKTYTQVPSRSDTITVRNLIIGETDGIARERDILDSIWQDKRNQGGLEIYLH